MNKCIIQVIGKKNSGKTLTIEKAVRELKSLRLSIAVIKHSHHEIDLQGKDTFRFWEAGSDYVVFLNQKGIIMGRFSVKDVLEIIPADVVLIEGYKDKQFGRLFEITKPEESDLISRKIIDYVKECITESYTQDKLIGDNGKELDFKDPRVLTLYNLMKSLNLSEVRIDKGS
ncbi:MAG: molybdopterin-guanine dinucleotide biosynthesis protein B [Sulfolobaceae archaeon]